LASAECRLTRRWHQLQRLLAVEQAAALPDGVSVLLGVSPYELGSSELADELLLLPPLVGGGQRLLVAIPDAAVSDAPAFHELCGRLRRGGFGIVHAVFAAGGAQLRQRRELAPDYVKLVGTLSRDLHASAPRRRQVRDVVEAAGEIGAAVIASDVRRAEEAAACRELGCTWAQGPWAQAAWQSTAALGERPPRA
jgi:EAL domain-containing protein (putative c-di-GMP-specific phosphodiesterase class I)